MISYEEYSKIRDSKGLKDGKVAQLAGIGRSTFSDWKSGRSVPKEDKARKIANALGVTYAYIMGWESTSEPSTMVLENIIQTNEEKGGSSTFAEYLYETTVKKPVAPSHDVTNEEFELIKQFRNADESVKDTITRLLAFAVEQDNKN